MLRLLEKLELNLWLAIKMMEEIGQIDDWKIML
jgi:hypothetical protein